MTNIEKIRQEIERRLKYTHDWLRGDEKRHPKQTAISKNYYKMKGGEHTLDALLAFIDSLSEEKSSLPDNLDEAAEEYAYNNWEDNDYHTGASEGLPFDAIGHTEKCFKSGAEWMAEQGVSTIAIVSTENGITEEGMKLIGDYLESLPDKTEVVLQIRKKTYNK